MMSPALHVRLRLPLAERDWGRLRSRANARRMPPAGYVDALLRYALHERLPVHPRPGCSEALELVYADLEVPALTKDRLFERSASEHLSVGAYAGLIITAFLVRFPKDPRDLAMIHYLSTRLDHASVLSEKDIRRAVEQCERNEQVRLPPGFFTKWVFSRLRSLVRTVEREGAQVQLTVAVLEEIVPEAHVSLT